MPQPVTNTPLNLPEPLRLQFQALEKHLWRMDTLVAASGAACGLILSFALIFISDRLWNTPVALRILITLSGAGVTVFFTWRWFHLWVWNRRDILDMSTLVQRHYRRLGDRLLGIVELADTSKRPANISQALCEAAIRQVSAEAKDFDFKGAVSKRQPKRFTIAFACLALAAGATCIAVPQASWNALLRWLLPASSVSRYTFVSLQDLPEHLVVAHGEPFEIACSLKYNSFWHPTSAYFQYERQPVIEAAVHGREVVFHVPAQTRNGLLKLQIGDDSRRIRIEPTFRPELKQLFAHLERPAYLQYPAADEEIHNGTLSLLENSRVSFRGKTSRALQKASLDIGKALPLRVRNDEFLSDPLALGDVSQCSFNWEDILKLKNAAPWTLIIQPQKDLPPLVRCPDLAAVTAMLVEETIEIPCEAQDDFGVRELGLSWEVASTRQTKAPPVHTSTKLKDGAPQTAKLEARYRFSPKLLNIPEDSLVTLHATARDYLPDRVTAESVTYRIYVLGLDEHARLVQKQLEELLARIEELTQRQDALENTTSETNKLTPEKLAEEKASDELGEQSSDQSSYAEQLERLSKEGGKIVREAMRNPSLSEEMIAEMSRLLQSMQDLAKGEMSKASKGLKASQKDKARRKEELEKALELEKQILQALRDMQKAMSESMDNMHAKNLAARLRKVALSETKIGGTMQEMQKIPEILGAQLETLSPKDRETTQSMASEQDQDHKEADKLQDEIQRFFHKTQLARYDDVHKEMVQTKTVEEMSAGSGLILRVQIDEMIRNTASWAGRFNLWADKLGTKDSTKRPSPGGGESQAMTEEQMKQMLEMIQNMTKMMRLREQEQELRDQTETLEQQKDKTPDHDQKAKDLASKQRSIMEQLRELQQKPSLAPLGKPMEQAGQAMSNAGAGLDKPDTGQQTVSEENTAIRLMSEMLEQMASQCGAGGQCMGMGMLLQMMGMGNGAGNSGGGSTAGGTTTQKPMNLTGDPNGNPADPHDVERATRKQGSALPSEYRDALQNYFNAIEQETP